MGIKSTTTSLIALTQCIFVTYLPLTTGTLPNKQVQILSVDLTSVATSGQIQMAQDLVRLAWMLIVMESVIPIITSLLEMWTTCRLPFIPPCLQYATIDIDPDTLNLNSRGRWITAYIELPEGYNVSDINVSTILLNDAISAELSPMEIGDYDNDGVPDIMVKFDRANVEELIHVPTEIVELTLTGTVSGIPFEGGDTIKVIKKGK